MVYNYCRPVHPVVTGILLVCFVYVFPALTFWPHLLPDGKFATFAHEVDRWRVQRVFFSLSGGSLHGLLVRYQTLLRGCFFLLILVHLTEAVFAMMICTYMDLGKNVTLRWGISVFVNGVFALRYRHHLPLLST